MKDNDEVQLITEQKTKVRNRQQKQAPTEEHEEDDVELNSKHADTKLINQSKTRDEYK